MQKPESMLPPQRFDLMAKYLYIFAKHHNLKTQFYRDMYIAHIRTFNNFIEPPDSNLNEKEVSKQGCEVFVSRFDALIDSLQSSGYDGNYPIPIGSNDIIINGSHRLVVSYFYNIKPIYKYCSSLGNTEYNYRFFKNSTKFPSLPRPFADAMALEYVKHNQNLRCMIVFPNVYTMNKMNQVYSIISQYGYIYYEKEVQLNKNGFNNLVKELYRGEKWIGGMFPRGWSSGGKAELCYDEYPTRYLSIVMNDVGKLVEMKEKCRSLFAKGKHSLHVSDFSKDTFRISSALLNQNSIDFLNNGTNDISITTNTNLCTFFKTFSQQPVCITSSVILEMFGLRKANDIDYIHVNDTPLDGFGIHSGKWLDFYEKGKDDILYDPSNHFYFNGMKFASLKTVYDMKRKRNEPKDVNDINLMDNFFNNNDD